MSLKNIIQHSNDKKGFMLMEVLVGTVISLAVAIAAMQIYTAFFKTFVANFNNARQVQEVVTMLSIMDSDAQSADDLIVTQDTAIFKGEKGDVKYQIQDGKLTRNGVIMLDGAENAAFFAESTANGTVFGLLHEKRGLKLKTGTVLYKPSGTSQDLNGGQSKNVKRKIKEKTKEKKAKRGNLHRP